jgi:hypothetical protein
VSSLPPGEFGFLWQRAAKEGLDMQFIFMDETHASMRGKKYSAAIASMWSAPSLRPFRDELIRSVASLVNVSQREVNRFPTLHATEMTKEYGDDVKFEILAHLAIKFDVKFFRLGYFDHAPLYDKFDALSLAINQLSAYITSSSTEEMIFVYELNQAKHTSIRNAYNDWHLQYLRMSFDPATISVKNSEMIFGMFYCDKQNYHMALTDMAAYVIRLHDKKNDNNVGTKFKQHILAKTSGLFDRFEMDQIIQVND